MTEVEAQQLQTQIAIDRAVPVNETNTLGMTLALIPPGELGLSAECRATISQPYRIGTTEVTRGQFRKFVQATGYVSDCERTGDGGDIFDRKAKFWIVNTPGVSWKDYDMVRLTDEHPIAMISYDDAVAFCDWLSRTEKKHYRLPTEAEWMWACRAGSSATTLHTGDVDALKKVCWFRLNSGDHTHPVGKLQANPWGLHDMYGNVNEKCGDCYGELPVGAFTDYCGVKGSEAFTIVGSNFFVATIIISDRTHSGRHVATSYNGFRVVQEIDPVTR